MIEAVKKFNSVLLIDDNTITNFVHERIINNVTDFIITHRSAENALIFLREKLESEGISPELILLDINLHDMDGFDFVKEFRKLKFKNEDKVTIVVVTDSKNEVDAKRFADIGIKHYLSKPLTKEKLENVLASLN